MPHYIVLSVNVLSSFSHICCFLCIMPPLISLQLQVCTLTFAQMFPYDQFVQILGFLFVSWT